MKRLPFIPTVLMLVVIAYLSLAERPIDPDRIPLFEGADKLAHGCMYLVLVWMVCFDLYRQLGRRVRGYWLFLTLGAMLFGGIMEWLQGVITIERSTDVADFVANCCGAIMGLLLAEVFVPRVYRWCCRWH